MSPVLAALSAALAAGLSLPWRGPARHATVTPPAARAMGGGWLLRFRLVWSVLAGLGGALFGQGRAAPVFAVAGAVGIWVVIGRAEPPDVRRARLEVRRDLPHVVDLLAAALRAGAAPSEAITVVCSALPGAATSRLAQVASRLDLGVDPALAWQVIGEDADLAVLGRAWLRAQSRGSAVVAATERLADDLARAGRAEVESRARAVGVKAALPLGLCLLPAFILIGIVPLVAGLAATIGL